MGYKYLLKIVRDEGTYLLSIDAFMSPVPICTVTIALAYSGEPALSPGERVMLRDDDALQVWMTNFFLHTQLCEDTAKAFAAHMMQRLQVFKMRFHMGLPLYTGSAEEERQ